MVRVRGRFDLATLPVDFVECLMRFLPTEAEVKALRQYERERKPLEELADEDRFMLQFSKVERLPQRMAIMAFLGNFAENLQMLTPVRSQEGGGLHPPGVPRPCVPAEPPPPCPVPPAAAQCHHCGLGLRQVFPEAEAHVGGECGGDQGTWGQAGLDSCPPSSR